MCFDLKTIFWPNGKYALILNDLANIIFYFIHLTLENLEFDFNFPLVVYEIALKIKLFICAGTKFDVLLGSVVKLLSQSGYLIFKFHHNYNQTNAHLLFICKLMTKCINMFGMDINLKSKSHHYRPTRDILKEICLGHLSY